MQEETVYAVEFSHRTSRDLMDVAKRRNNIILIVKDARHPYKYRTNYLALAITLI